ncbi:TIGR02253 family HAD-type hydrolase [Candidatus Bathyarchaeota archaeon]|nr:MAG: TIGR02253 family HAD-type hydrolase [Candidatus Bathyarchaeota archaeon]
MKAVLFDIEDTLYDTSLQMRMTRLNAVRAMIGAGLPIDLETGYKTLEEIVNQYGPHYTKHFDRLLERLGLKWDPAVIAAGVVAYRETSDAYLKPFPDTVPTLIRLRDMGYKLGVVSAGRSVKQWQKLIQLGVHHLFHSVVISEEQGTEDFNVELFMKCMDELGVKPGETVYLSSKPNKGILYANKAGIVTVRVRRGDSTLEEPESEEAKARFEIERLSEIFDVLKNIEKSSSTQ